MITATGVLRTLVVDDEAPAREELAYLLGRDERVADVQTAASAAEALRLLGAEPVDVVFCDIKMPGLDGVELAHVLSRFALAPQIVFVTAYDDHAVDAFELQAADYLVKPVRPERLGEAVRRVAAVAASAASATATQPTAAAQAPTATLSSEPSPEDETIPVELAGVTRFVRRSQVRYVEAQGDYARLHTGSGSHLVRTPLASFEQRWAATGFVRIHRSTLVSIGHVDELRVTDGHCVVRLGEVLLPVSRRHTRALRDLLVRHQRGRL
jgi:DNA-binding LytR/AlgR family response regulator